MVSRLPLAWEPRIYRRLSCSLLVAFLCLGARADAAAQFVRGWGSGPGPGQLGGPYGIAVAPDGYVYVTDQHLCRVVKFTRDGQFVTAWGSCGSAPGQFGLPIGIAVDSLNRVLVVDFGNHRISMFTSDGGFVRQWGSEGGGPGQFGSYMRRLLISPDGNVVVPNGNGVSVFDSTGAYQYAWGSGGEPSAIALDGQGDYYVLSENNSVSSTHIEDVVLPVDSQVLASRRQHATLVPIDARGLEFGDIALLKSLLDSTVETKGGGLKVLDQFVPVGHDVFERRLRHLLPLLRSLVPSLDGWLLARLFGFLPIELKTASGS